MDIEIRQLTEERFSNLEGEWQELVLRSDADGLFQSWGWQWYWWQVWGNQLGFELILLGAYTDKKLIGIFPLMRKQIGFSSIFSIHQIQFVGFSWPWAETVRTEYSGPIVDKRYDRIVYGAVWQYMVSTIDWDVFAVRDVVCDGAVFDTLSHLADSCAIKYDIYETDRGGAVDTQCSFQSYVDQRSKNTRYKLFNCRKKLEKRGDVSEVSCDDSNIGYFFDELNRFHQHRWGKPCFDGGALEFHQRLARWMLAKGQCNARLLLHKEEVVSVIYDLIGGDRSYNIQSGYAENYLNNTSLGTLHLGYSIEQYCNQSEIHFYDLLAGEGKNRFYKQKLVSDAISFASVNFFKSLKGKLFYILFKYTPHRYRSFCIKRDGF